ncbi:MAG: UDP-N-acetylmuramoyl-L-alanyl-D-glutamate--2,6-diaminopimelate ligase, partial [Betaproteobacteria bacterium]|nr:UDP-N-acetylmuramoyl-L-alanyl-D-glutamate--2,6-diaminopimelate ligase [Betaproteobacteria bacterium]
VARGLGVPHEVEPDRARAIAAAISDAAPADVVLIAGKGHEAYQEIAGRRLPFSDAAVAQAVLASRATA